MSIVACSSIVYLQEAHTAAMTVQTSILEGLGESDAFFCDWDYDICALFTQHKDGISCLSNRASATVVDVLRTCSDL